MTNSQSDIISPHKIIFEPIIRRALEEDLGRAGDITSAATVPPETRGQARIIAKDSGCIAGLEIALHTFQLVDPQVSIDTESRDGDWVESGKILARMEGSAVSILTAERTVLNILGHLSGIATETSKVVRLISKTSSSIACTRKTTPGLRSLEKYAVRCGGGRNHRFGLDDAVLIKENHISMAGGIASAISRAREQIGHMVKIEVEVENLSQLDEALQHQIDAVLLDNMSLEDIASAVVRVNNRIAIEVSGGITRESVLEIAQTGVNIISMGWLTHSARSLDVSLYLDPLH